jgi:hypothetical protein
MAGYLGLDTGMSVGRFTLSLNARVHQKDALDLVKSGNFVPIGYWLRK